MGQGGGRNVDVENVLRCYSKYYKLKISNISGDSGEYSYELSIDSRKTGELLKEINAISDVTKTNMVSFYGEAL